MIYSPEKKLIVPQKNEVLRYLGYFKNSLVDEITDTLIDMCIEEMHDVITPKAVYEIFDLDVSGEEIRFSDVLIKSQDLARNLGNVNSNTDGQSGGDNANTNPSGQSGGACKKVVLLAATIGMQVDTLIKKATKLDTAKAAIFQATGAMFIEEVVEGVVAEIKKFAETEGLSVRPRYSPGYGDVPLEIQKDFFRLLPCAKIGLTLMDTLVMAPEKSVTAFVGLFSK